MKIKKISLKICALLTILFLVFPVNAFAAPISGMEPDAFASAIFAQIAVELGVSTNDLAELVQNAVLENTTTADESASVFKLQAPDVSITFIPSSPIPGQKVTAIAQPTNFTNPPAELYYTWMLRHKEDKKDDSHDDLEKYKVSAARIIANGGFNWENADYSDDSDGDGYKARFGGNDQGEKESYCFYLNTNTGEFFPDDSASAIDDTNAKGFECEHLFPDKDFTDGHDIADNSFGKDEEKFWHTNPNNQDTSGRGQVDEATVAGLGISSFSWTYQEGDQVGLAVEGISIFSTKTSDTAYKTMWAISGKGCDDADSIESVEDIHDECLPRSFVSPMEGANADKFDIQLDYSPKFPTYAYADDPDSASETKENFDLIHISSSITGEKANGALLYTWKVFTGDTADENSSWTQLKKSDLRGVKQTSGTGIDSLRFGLILGNKPKYLKVELTASESNQTAEANMDQRKSVVIIPLTQGSEGIKIFAAAVSAESSSVNPALSKGEERCSNINKICQVAKNEIMVAEASAKLSNFLWTLNGEPLTYDYDTALATPPNIVYFPVSKNVGDEFILSMTANKTTGEKVVLAKTFKVMDPDLMIISGDESTCAPTILGYFINPDGTESPDTSEKNFEALQGSTIKLSALFLGPTQDLSSLQWIVPEAKLSSFGKDFSFVADAALGSTYTVYATMTYRPSMATRAALFDYWGLSSNTFYEKKITQKINIDVVDSINPEGGTELTNSSRKPVASVFSGISDYFIFLFKISLTATLLIFLLGIFSSLASNREIDVK